MRKATDLISLLVFIVGATTLTPAQGNSSTPNNVAGLKTLIVAAEAKSDSLIVVPPATSVTVSLIGKKYSAGTDAVDLRNWLSKETALNGLESTDLRPWHVVVTYDQFDEDGDNVHSGTFEEYWAGPQKYKRIYQSDDFNQTDYGTDKGLFRRGDQKWPDPAQVQVGAEVLDPFFYAATFEDFRARNVESTFSGHTLQCVVLGKNAGMSDPAQYCFEPNGSILRYSRGSGWFQTAYNRIVTFQGRNIAQEVDVTDGGKPYLKLRVNTIELLPKVQDADFLPPSDAVGPLGDRISGVQEMPIKTGFPDWPASLRDQHFTVTVEIVIGKDGHVISARGISGPLQGYKACEDSVRKWIFPPYLVINKPVEVEEKVLCSNN